MCAFKTPPCAPSSPHNEDCGQQVQVNWSRMFENRMAFDQFSETTTSQQTQEARQRKVFNAPNRIRANREKFVHDKVDAAVLRNNAQAGRVFEQGLSHALHVPEHEATCLAAAKKKSSNQNRASTKTRHTPPKNKVTPHHLNIAKQDDKWARRLMRFSQTTHFLP